MKRDASNMEPAALDEPEAKRVCRRRPFSFRVTADQVSVKDDSDQYCFPTLHTMLDCSDADEFVDITLPFDVDYDAYTYLPDMFGNLDRLKSCSPRQWYTMYRCMQYWACSPSFCHNLVENYMLHSTHMVRLANKMLDLDMYPYYMPRNPMPWDTRDRNPLRTDSVLEDHTYVPMEHIDVIHAERNECTLQQWMVDQIDGMHDINEARGRLLRHAHLYNDKTIVAGGAVLWALCGPEQLWSGSDIDYFIDEGFKVPTFYKSAIRSVKRSRCTVQVTFRSSDLVHNIIRVTSKEYTVCRFDIDCVRASYVNDEFRVSVRFLQAVHRRVANCNDEDLTLTALARMGKYARRGFRPPSKWRDIVCSPHTSQAKSANMFDVPVDFVMNSCDKLEWLRYDKDGNYKRPVPTLPHDMYVYQQRRGLNRSTQDYRDIDRFVDTGIHIYLKNVKVWSAFVRLSDEQIDLVVDALRNYTGPEQNTAEIIASIDDPVMRSNGINVDFQGASLPPKGTVCDITMNFVATEATKETYLGENEGESLFDTQEELLMWPNPSVSC